MGKSPPVIGLSQFNMPSQYRLDDKIDLSNQKNNIINFNNILLTSDDNAQLSKQKLFNSLENNDGLTNL